MMGLFDFLSGGKPADKLKKQVQEVKQIMGQVGSASGPASDPQRQRLVSDWIGNFARNLEAATTALATGRDMRMQPIVTNQIAAGLTKMCDDFGQQKLLDRLGQVCDRNLQKRFQTVIQNVKSIAKSI